MRKKFSVLQSKPCFQISQCSSKPVIAVICIYFSRMLVSNFQNNSPFNPFSDSCLSKISVNTWFEEHYVGDLHAIPTKYRNKLLSFYYRKIAIAQSNEKERISWLEVWSIHNKQDIRSFSLLWAIAMKKSVYLDLKCEVSITSKIYALFHCFGLLQWKRAYILTWSVKYP